MMTIGGVKLKKKINLRDIDVVLEFIDESDEYEFDHTYEIDTKLNESDFTKFKEYVINNLEKREYFECIVDGDVKETRFGVINHKEVEDGYQIKGPLVEKEYDDNQEPSIYDSNFEVNIKNEVLKTKIINDKLIEFLTDKGLMSTGEKEKILNVSHREILEKHFDYNTF